MVTSRQIKAGGAVVTVTLDTGQLRQNARNAGRQAGATLGRTMTQTVRRTFRVRRTFGLAITRGLQRINISLAKTAFLFGGVSALMSNFGKDFALNLGQALKISTSFEETMNRFRVVFGENSQEVDAWAQTFSDSVNRSELDVKNFLSTFQQFFRGFGFGNEQATEFSKTLTTLTADLASLSERADEDVSRRLFAGLSGSPEALDVLGINVRQPAIEAALQQQGILFKNATELEKVQARLNVIIKQSALAAGDAFNTYNSFANSLKGLRATFIDLQVAVGDALKEALRPLLAAGRGIIDFVAQWATEQENLGRVLLTGIATYTSAAFAFGVMAIAIGGLAIAFTGLVGTVSLLTGALTLITSPLVLVAGTVTALVASSIDWNAVWKSMGASIRGLVIDLSELEDTLGVVLDLLSVGEVGAAFELTVLQMQKTWQEFWVRFIASAKAAFANFQTEVANMVIRFGESVNSLVDSVSDAFAQIGDRMNIFSPDRVQELGGTIREYSLPLLQLHKLLKQGQQAWQNWGKVRDAVVTEGADLIVNTARQAEATAEQFISPEQQEAMDAMQERLNLRKGELRATVEQTRAEREAKRQRDRTQEAQELNFRRRRTGIEMTTSRNAVSQIMDVFRASVFEPLGGQAEAPLGGPLGSADVVGNFLQRGLLSTVRLLGTLPGQLAASATALAVDAAIGAPQQARRMVLEDRLSRLGGMLGSEGAFSARAALLSGGRAVDPGRQREEIIRKLEDIERNTRRGGRGIGIV